jgi:hypothetical protein
MAGFAMVVVVGGKIILSENEKSVIGTQKARVGTTRSSQVSHAMHDHDGRAAAVIFWREAPKPPKTIMGTLISGR